MDWDCCREIGFRRANYTRSSLSPPSIVCFNIKLTATCVYEPELSKCASSGTDSLWFRLISLCCQRAKMNYWNLLIVKQTDAWAWKGSGKWDRKGSEIGGTVHFHRHVQLGALCAGSMHKQRQVEKYLRTTCTSIC